MPEQQIPLLKGDKIENGLQTDYRDALPVNMYAVERAVLGAAGYVISYPGLTSLGTGQGKDRGGIFNERFNEHYRVSGSYFISVSKDGAVAVLGFVPGFDQCTITGYSHNTQCIVGGGRAYLYSPSGGFAQINDANIGIPIDVASIAPGFYVFTDGEYLYHTDLLSETTINPLSYATSEFMPDRSVGISINSENRIMAWSRYSLEYFAYNAQASGFAFQNLGLRSQKIGIIATHAKVEVAGKFYITGGRKEEGVGVHIVGTGTTQKISSREIDKLLKEYTEPQLSDIRMEGRLEDNVTFVLVHLPNETICFNESIANKFGLESAWTILKSDVQGDTVYRAINGVHDPRSSKWVYGDKQGTSIAFLDNDSCTHYGQITEWILYTPMVKLEGFSVDQIEIETIPGHTVTNDAVVFFSMSYDGLTYGTEHIMQYGGPNEYNKRFFARGLGYVSNTVSFKFRGATRSRMAFCNLKLTYS